MTDGTQPRAGQNSIYRSQFLCYSSMRCDRPSHMAQPLTAPWGVQGSIVDETVGGPETCTDDFQYEQWSRLSQLTYSRSNVQLSMRIQDRTHTRSH